MSLCFPTVTLSFKEAQAAAQLYKRAYDLASDGQKDSLQPQLKASELRSL
jgi:hypothetical protein